MVVALDPKRGLPVVLESELDLPESQQTKFLMLPLRQGQAATVDEMAGKVPKSKELADLAIDNIVGWTNFKDQDGREIAFTKEEARDRLSLRILVELGSRVMHGLDGEQAKNYSSRSDEREGSTPPSVTEITSPADGAEQES